MSIFFPNLYRKGMVKIENSTDNSLTEIAEIPKDLIQKWRKMKYKGELFPSLISGINSTIGRCA